MAGGKESTGREGIKRARQILGPDRAIFLLAGYRERNVNGGKERNEKKKKDGKKRGERNDSYTRVWILCTLVVHSELFTSSSQNRCRFYTCNQQGCLAGK